MIQLGQLARNPGGRTQSHPGHRLALFVFSFFWPLLALTPADFLLVKINTLQSKGKWTVTLHLSEQNGPGPQTWTGTARRQQLVLDGLPDTTLPTTNEAEAPARLQTATTTHTKTGLVLDRVKNTTSHAHVGYAWKSSSRSRRCKGPQPGSLHPRFACGTCLRILSSAG